MQLRHLSTEDRTVSPVIGAILMVAITVVLVAAVGTLVLGLGNQVNETSPQTSFSLDYDGTDDLTIAHESSEQIAAGQVTIVGNFFNPGNNWTGYGGSNPITAGGSAVVNNSGGFADDDAVRVVWDSQSGSTPPTLQQWIYNGQMDSKYFLAEGDVISPVIDVILMVAITIILVIVTGTFVPGLGNQVSNTALQTSFGLDYNSTTPTVAHKGGTSIDIAQVNITSSVTLNDFTSRLAGASGTTETWESITSDSEITAGGQAAVVEQNADDLSTATVRAIWTSESGSNSVTLQS